MSKKTARSQRHGRHDALARYGYPSSRELRREAQGLASAAVPTIRSVRRPYERQLQSTKDFLGAINMALQQTSAGVGQGYDQALSQSQAVDQAAQARLAGLGIGGADAASAQAVTGALGDSATQNLIANAASAKNYAAKLPGIAAGQASVQRAGINKSMLDALANRRDNLSQAFFQALSQVQQQHLQMASFNQASDQFQQQMAQSEAQMAEGIREFNASQATSNRQFNEQMAYNYASLAAQTSGGGGKTSKRSVQGIAHALGLTPNEVQTQVSAASKALAGDAAPTDKVPIYGKPDANGTRHITGYQLKPRMVKDPNTGKMVPVGGTGIIDHGVLFPSAIAGLVANGFDPRIATYAATQLYQSLPKSAPTYGPMWNSFVSWMAKHGSAKYVKIATAQNRRIAIRNSGRDFPGNQ